MSALFARALPYLAAAFAALWLLPVSTAWTLAPDLGHAWAAPVLMAYLWWERWAERPSSAGVPPAPSQLSHPAAALVFLLPLAALELFLRLFLTPFPLWPALLLVYTALFAAIALTAAWLLAGRAGVRWLGGPLLLLVSTLPIPSLIENAIIIPLRTGMATLAAEISNLAGHPAIAMGTSVRLGGGWVGIDEACGGIRSLQACVMIGLFFGEWYRFNARRRIVLLVAAVGSALLGNFARVLFLSLLANSGTHAVEQAHDPAGWLAMTFSLILTGWLACRWAGYRWPDRKLAAPAVARATCPRFFAFAPALTALVLLFALNEAVTRLWFAHGERQRSAVAHWTAALPTGDPTFQSQSLAETSRDMLRPDVFVAGRWRGAPDTYVFAYYIEWKKGQLARSLPFLHNPTICLPAAGCELVGALPTLTLSTPAGDVPFFAYQFRRAGEELFVAFTIWDTSRGHPLENPSPLQSWRQWWLTRWTEVAEARQNQPAQLLTLVLPNGPKARDEAQRALRRLVEPVALD